MGRRPAISRPAAAIAALGLIDEEGLDALTLAALARRLGVRAPSLYNHFADRADLLRLVARTVLAEAGELPAADAIAGAGATDAAKGSWRDLLAQRAVLVRRAIVAHPHAAPLLLETPPRLAAPAVYEHWTEVLAESGVPADQWLVILEGLEGITYGSALFAAAGARAAGRDGAAPVVDDERSPTFARALAAERRTPEQLFVAAVAAFLAGIDAP